MWLSIFPTGADSRSKGQICFAAFVKVSASTMMEVLRSGERTDGIFHLLGRNEAGQYWKQKRKTIPKQLVTSSCR